MRTLLPSPDRTILFLNECVECGSKTPHQVFVEQYHCITHNIGFVYWCTECALKNPNDCAEFRATYTIYQWLHWVDTNESVRDS